MKFLQPRFGSRASTIELTTKRQIEIADAIDSPNTKETMKTSSTTGHTAEHVVVVEQTTTIKVFLVPNVLSSDRESLRKNSDNPGRSAELNCPSANCLSSELDATRQQTSWLKRFASSVLIGLGVRPVIGLLQKGAGNIHNTLRPVIDDAWNFIEGLLN